MSAIDSEPEVLNKEDCVEQSTNKIDSVEKQTNTENKCQSVFVIFIDDELVSYSKTFEQAKKKAYFYASQEMLQETDRIFYTEWIDNSLYLKSYPKFSVTRYDRLDLVIDIEELEEESDLEEETENKEY